MKIRPLLLVLLVLLLLVLPEVTVNENNAIVNECHMACILPILPVPEVELSSSDLLNGLGSA